MPRELTPQEKKKLSYERDRRNDYGENDKASRKAIPLHKRKVIRAYRKSTKQQLPKNEVALDSEAAEAVEQSVLRVARKGWRKVPDMPLGEFIDRQKKRAVVRSGRKARDRSRRDAEG
jgi:hypothetical protein